MVKDGNRFLQFRVFLDLSAFRLTPIIIGAGLTSQITKLKDRIILQNMITL